MPPEEPYYLDLLEKGDYQGHTYDSGDGDDTYSGLDWSYSEEEIAALDSELLDALRAAVPEGWHACTAQGTNGAPMWGDLIGSGRRRGAAPFLPLPWRTGYVSDHSRNKKRRKLGIRSPAPGNAAIQRNGELGGKDRQRAQSGHGLCAAIPVHPPPYPADRGAAAVCLRLPEQKKLAGSFLLVNLVTQGGFAVYLAVSGVESRC